MQDDLSNSPSPGYKPKMPPPLDDLLGKPGQKARMTRGGDILGDSSLDVEAMSDAEYEAEVVKIVRKVLEALYGSTTVLIIPALVRVLGRKSGEWVKKGREDAALATLFLDLKQWFDRGVEDNPELH